MANDDLSKQLHDLNKGKSMVYHSGPDLGSAGKIATQAMDLYKSGRVTLVRRRTVQPMFMGVIDRVRGVGSFDYIAQGLV